MRDIVFYTYVAVAMLSGTYFALLVADHAIERQNRICQEGCF